MGEGVIYGGGVGYYRLSSKGVNIKGGTYRGGRERGVLPFE